MKIREFLSSPDKLARGAWARDSEGLPVNINSGEACSYCLLGAARFCYGNDTKEFDDVFEKLTFGVKKLSKLGIIAFSDNQPFEKVKTLVDELDI